MYPVFTYKTDMMKKIQQLVSRGGYSRYTTGTIEIKKLDKFLYKLEDRYRINATRQMRYRAKQRGEANVEIVMWKENDLVHFWLMVSLGAGVIEDMEKLHSVTDKKHRITVTGFELVRTQRSEKARWTWRMSKENYADFEVRIKNACRHKNDDHIRQCIYSLERMPVFSEMRQQAFELFKFLKGEYKRAYSQKFPFPELKKNFHGRFKSPTSLSAIDLARKARNLKPLQQKPVEADLAPKPLGIDGYEEDILAEWTDLKETHSNLLAQIEAEETELTEAREPDKATLHALSYELSVAADHLHDFEVQFNCELAWLGKKEL